MIGFIKQNIKKYYHLLRLNLNKWAVIELNSF